MSVGQSDLTAARLRLPGGECAWRGWRGRFLMGTVDEIPVLWEPGSPAAASVPEFLGLSGGGSHHAVARAFVGSRSRGTYVMLRPSHPSAAAFRWPPSGVEGGSSLACSCPPSPADDRRGRSLEVKVYVVDIDTFLAPRVLPARLRPHLLACVQQRKLRVCHCLLLRDMNTPYPLTEVGAHLSTLLGLPIFGRLSEPATLPHSLEEVD